MLTASRAAYPFSDLSSDISRLERSRVPGEALAREADDAFCRWLEDGWKAPSRARQDDMAQLRDAEREAVAYVTGQVAARIQDAAEDGGGAHLHRRAEHLAHLAGEHLVAMRMASMPAPHTEFAATVSSEMIRAAHLAGFTRDLCRICDVTPSDVAPAVLAVIATGDAGGGGSRRARELAGVFRSHLNGEDLDHLTRVCREAVKQGQAVVEEPIRQYVTQADKPFRVEPTTTGAVDEHGHPRHVNSGVGGANANKEVGPGRFAHRALAALEGESSDAHPEIRLGPTIAFASSARGGGDAARIEGALEVYQSLAAYVRARDGRATGRDAPRIAALVPTMDGLRAVADQVEAERSVHRDVERRWKDVDFEIKMAKQRRTTAVFPLPDTYSALESRALYLQDAISNGVLSLGRALAELDGSPTLTYGSSERAFFENLAFYAARKYAANFESEADVRVDCISPHAVRVEEVRRVLSAIEIEMRAHGHLSAEDMRELAEARLDEALGRGEVKRAEVRVLRGQKAPPVDPSEAEGLAQPAGAAQGSIVEGMIARVQANKEVSILTAARAIDAAVPDEIVQSASDLPHTRWIGMSTSRAYHLSANFARNGQRMDELERSTRARWIRYRQQAPRGRDVRHVEVENGNANSAKWDTPMKARTDRPFAQTKKAGRKEVHIGAGRR